MSMNLYFRVKGGGHVDFPYQTRTNLSYAVLNAPTIEEKLRLLEDDLKNCEDDEWRKQLLEQIKILLNNPNLELGVI